MRPQTMIKAMVATVFLTVLMLSLSPPASASVWPPVWNEPIEVDTGATEWGGVLELDDGGFGVVYKVGEDSFAAIQENPDADFGIYELPVDPGANDNLAIGAKPVAEGTEIQVAEVNSRGETAVKPAGTVPSTNTPTKGGLAGANTTDFSRVVCASTSVDGEDYGETFVFKQTGETYTQLAKITSNSPMERTKVRQVSFSERDTPAQNVLLVSGDDSHTHETYLKIIYPSGDVDHAYELPGQRVSFAAPSFENPGNGDLAFATIRLDNDNNVDLEVLSAIIGEYSQLNSLNLAAGVALLSADSMPLDIANINGTLVVTYPDATGNQLIAGFNYDLTAAFPAFDTSFDDVLFARLGQEGVFMDDTAIGAFFMLADGTIVEVDSQNPEPSTIVISILGLIPGVWMWMRRRVVK